MTGAADVEGRLPGGALAGPALILAADHRARGVVTIERYDDYPGPPWPEALPTCDGLLASAQPLGDLAVSGGLFAPRASAPTSRSTAPAWPGRPSSSTTGWWPAWPGRPRRVETGVKHMTRIDLSDPATAPALELLGQVLEEAQDVRLEALVESVKWRDKRP